MAPLPTEVRPSALGGGAVLRGALLTARESAQDDLFARRRRAAPKPPGPGAVTGKVTRQTFPDAARLRTRRD